MKVAIGAVAGTSGGPATYSVELVRALAAAFPEDRYVVLTDRPESFASFAETRPLPLRSAWMQPLWDHVQVPRALAREPFDLYHATKGVMPRLAWLRSVVTVHDLAGYVMPETFSLAQRLHLAWETPRAVARAGAIVVPSASTAADVARRFPASAGKVRTIPEAPGASARPVSAAEVENWRQGRGLGSGHSRPLCGYLGTIQPRKNLELLASAFLRAAGDRDWRLVLAGRLRPGYRPACLQEGDPRIVYLGPLPDEEVAPFFGALRCMVSPSAYEGFGLTVVEAMACGCPVVALRNSSLPEVVGDAGVLVDAADVATLAPVIDTLMSDDREVAELSRRGRERAARFSWRQAALRTRAVYQEVLAAPGGIVDDACGGRAAAGATR
ncbi:MAG: glycosyltransferase family 4 protein [Deltaproteobacteria bacterium]|nr:glycosyltransferase family 4 protein [Deltaproteobacteria bacterium]